MMSNVEILSKRGKLLHTEKLPGHVMVYELETGKITTHTILPCRPGDTLLYQEVVIAGRAHYARLANLSMNREVLMDLPNTWRTLKPFPVILALVGLVLWNFHSPIIGPAMFFIGTLAAVVVFAASASVQRNYVESLLEHQRSYTHPH